MDKDTLARAEDVLRLLATAASVSRLYPATNPMPQEAIGRFVQSARTLTAAHGTLRFTVDPKGLRIEDVPAAEGQAAVAGLAESLHALQVGQLIVAPEVTPEETRAFLDLVNAEARDIRERGGIRSALGAAGVSRIAVIEVTLRASTEEGILGLDLTTAPLPDIAQEVQASVESWVSAAAGGEVRDDLLGAVDRLEEATQKLARERIAQALLRLDEGTRARLMSSAFALDSTTPPMEGMMQVIADMQPAALARLLSLAAMMTCSPPSDLVQTLDLPPEIMREVLALLSPSPRSEAECGVPPEVDAGEVAREARAMEDESDLDRQIALAAPSLASGRALATAVAIARTHPTPDAVEAIGVALPAAARDGAFTEVREALRRLDEMRSEASLAFAIDSAYIGLSDPQVLADVCRNPSTDAEMTVAADLLAVAGTPGAEALLNHFLETSESRRLLLLPAMRGLSDGLLSAASRRLRSASIPSAVALLKVIPLLGDKRAVSVVEQGMEHLDSSVRRAAVTALAETRTSDASRALTKAVGHWDPETQRFAISEIGRVHLDEALPAVVRVLEDIKVWERNHEIKKEAIKCLEALGSSKAIPILRRMSQRRLALGRQTKELRFLARQALNRLDGGEANRT